MAKTGVYTNGGAVVNYHEDDLDPGGDGSWSCQDCPAKGRGAYNAQQHATNCRANSRR